MAAWGGGSGFGSAKLTDKADNSSVGRGAKSALGEDTYNFATDPNRRINKGDASVIFDPANANKRMGKAFGWNNDKQKQKMKESEALRHEHDLDTRGILDQMNEYENGFLTKQQILQDQAQDQATNAHNVYTNDISPRLKSIMEDAQKNAAGAMTLQEAGDVNNSVQTSVRKLYDDQAQDVRRQSLADNGVLQAMGAQATSNQMGSAGQPLTNAQVQLMGANNQQQAGLAYARAQQQMQALREQGLDRGFSESAAQYDRGVNAKNFYNQSIGNYEGAMDNDITRQRGFRNELGSYNSQRLGINMGQSTRDMGYENQVYGGNQEGIAQAIAMANADNAAKAQLASSFMQVGGTAVGTYFGGPEGGKAGGAMGKGIGDGGKASGQTPVPQQQQQPAYGQQSNYGAQGYTQGQNAQFNGGYGQQQPQQQYRGYA